ncbi:hypothetical protein ES044_17595 [Polaribacter sp. IC066]|uniref:hypothetical protein n=1 Tax=Polaribacter sp. IC066 TaxID=57032 RepID=UPI0011BFDBD1|nr:hypothetical protein [Polaribacter sp. IC066]TXD55923.1 hypothetical protein ES044_17595 [Polaribacter sp. IC066]
MKNLKVIFLITILFMSCEKENMTLENQTNSDFKLISQEFNYNLNNYEVQDKIKIVVGEALNNLLINSHVFRGKIIEHLISDNKKTKELLYIRNKNLVFENGKTLENLILNEFEINSEKYNLIKQIEVVIPNLVIKIPDWANIIFENISTYDGLEFSIYPGLNTKNSFYFNQRKTEKIISTTTLADYIPIQIKESEKLIPLKKSSNETIWNDNLINDHFPSLARCTEFNREDYITYNNSEYDFLDKMTLNEDLLNAKLCGVEIIGGGNSSSNCSKVYERDCVTEKNVIEGFKFANYATLLAVNNQPGGEDVLALHYNFSVASMCGNLDNTQVCPPTDWKFVFFGTFNTFFERQFHWGTPSSSDLGNVSFKGRVFWLDYYIKSIPKYYDIPVDFSREQIYSQVRFLDLTPSSTWDGNVYGNAISMAIYEHDDVIVKESTTNSITITNSTKISNKLKIGENFESSSDFSNSVTRTSSSTITIDASKDVELGKRAINYYDQNYSLPGNGYGFNITTGAINTHFAFYY